MSFVFAFRLNIYNVDALRRYLFFLSKGELPLLYHFYIFYIQMLYN